MKLVEPGSDLVGFPELFEQFQIFSRTTSRLWS